MWCAPTAIVKEHIGGAMKSLGNEFSGPVDYSVRDRDDAFYWMITTGRCWYCSHMVIEEPVPGGTMISCLSGDVYENGEKGCGTRFWVVED